MKKLLFILLLLCLSSKAAVCLRFSAVSVTRSAKTAPQAADDDWPRWRGPSENGMARGDAPVEWGEGKNIAWRAPIPGRGQSSPVIWGDKIFITTAVPTQAAAAPAEPASTGTPP